MSGAHLNSVTIIKITLHMREYKYNWIKYGLEDEPEHLFSRAWVKVVDDRREAAKAHGILIPANFVSVDQGEHFDAQIAQVASRFRSPRALRELNFFFFLGREAVES